MLYFLYLSLVVQLNFIYFIKLFHFFGLFTIKIQYVHLGKSLGPFLNLIAGRETSRLKLNIILISELKLIGSHWFGISCLGLKLLKKHSGIGDIFFYFTKVDVFLIRQERGLITCIIAVCYLHALRISFHPVT